MENKENENKDSLAGTTESNSSEKVDNPVEGLENQETNQWIGKNEPDRQSNNSQDTSLSKSTKTIIVKKQKNENNQKK